MITRIKQVGITMFTFLFMGLSTTLFAQMNKGNETKADKKEVTTEKEPMHCKAKVEGDDCCGIKDLTDDQKQKMQTMKTAHQKEMLQFENQLNEKKSKIRTLETADNADLNAIYKTIDEILVLKGDMMKKCASHKQEIRALLSVQQRVEFDLKDSKMGMREHHKKMCNKPMPCQEHTGAKK